MGNFYKNSFKIQSKLARARQFGVIFATEKPNPFNDFQFSPFFRGWLAHRGMKNDTRQLARDRSDENALAPKGKIILLLVRKMMFEMGKSKASREML